MSSPGRPRSPRAAAAAARDPRSRRERTRAAARGRRHLHQRGQFEVRASAREGSRAVACQLLLVLVHLVLRVAARRGVVDQLPERERAPIGQQPGVPVRLAVQPRAVVRGVQRTVVGQCPVQPPYRLVRAARRSSGHGRGAARDAPPETRATRVARTLPSRTERSRLLPALLHVTLWVHTVAPRADIMSGNRENVRTENAAGRVRSSHTARRNASKPLGQRALPAVQALHAMFQPLRPLSGATVLSGEFLTVTTSPTSELSKNHLATVRRLRPARPPSPRSRGWCPASRRADCPCCTSSCRG